MFKRIGGILKGLFSGNGREISKDIAKVNSIRRFQGDPEDYERWEDEDMYGIGADTINPANDVEDFLKLYQVNPWAYACVQGIATAMASVNYLVTDTKDEEDKKHSINKVLENPNPHQVYYEFVESSIIYLELSGEVFWEEVYDDAKNLIAIYPLRPDKVRIVPHPKVKVAGYIYEPRPGVEIFYGVDEITHIKYFSPLDEYRGLSPACAATLSLTLNTYATIYNKKFFKNSAVPEGVLETEGSISEQTFLRLRRQWNQRHKGVDKAFELAILEEGLKYKPIGFNHRDMQMAEMSSMTREEALACWRVPPGIVGLLQHANYSNLREQKKIFYMDNVIPKMNRIRQIMNKNLMPPGTRIKFQIEEITAIVEDIQVLTQVAMALVTHGIWTINEVRRKLYNKKDVDWGHEPWMPVGLAQPSAGLNAGAQQQGMEGAPGMPGYNEMMRTQSYREAQNQSTPMGGSLPHEKADFEKMAAKDPDWNDKDAVRNWRVWNIWKGLATPDYREVKLTMKNFFAEQMARILPKIMAEYPIKESKLTKKSQAQKIAEEAYTDPYTFAKTEPFPPEIERMLFSISMERSKLKMKLGPLSKKIVKKHGSFTLGVLKTGVDFDMKEPRIESFLRKHSGDYIDDINRTTRDVLGRELTKALKDGEGSDEVMVRIHSVFKGDISEARARAIARTETVTLTQFSRLEAAKQSGVVKKKRWISEQLDTTRDRPGGENHFEMHGVEIGIDEYFDVPARKGKIDKMQGPGDETASPENIVNCVCILDFPDTLEAFADVQGEEGIEEARSIAEELSEEAEERRLSEEKRDMGNQQPVVVNLNVHKLVNPPQEPPKIELRPIINVEQPEIKAPDVNVRVRVPKTKAPVVKVDSPKVEVKPEIKIDVPPPPVPVEKKQPNIIVNVEPKISVDAKLKMPKRVERTEVQRDERTGRVTGVTKTEESVEEDEKKDKKEDKE